MRSSTQIDNHIFEVEFTNFGGEKYFIDGQLIEKRWNLYISGVRQFTVGNRNVKVEVCCRPGNYYCRLLVDNEIHTERLFPEVDEKISAYAERRKSIKPLERKIKTIIIILVVAAVLVTIFRNV